MKGCRQWVERAPRCEEKHRVGTCRRCWQLCRKPVARHVTRCEECNYALLTDRNAFVRLTLVYEPGVSLELLQILIHDKVERVAAAASARLYSTPSPHIRTLPTAPIVIPTLTFFAASISSPEPEKSGDE